MLVGVLFVCKRVCIYVTVVFVVIGKCVRGAARWQIAPCVPPFFFKFEYTENIEEKQGVNSYVVYRLWPVPVRVKLE